MKLESVSVKKGRRESLFLIIASLSALLAATVVSAAPIYFDSIEQLGVQRMVGGFTPAQNGAWVHVDEVTFNPAAIAATQRSVDRAGDELGAIVRQRAQFLRSGRLGVAAVDESPPPPALDFHYQSVEGIELDIDIVEGALPSATSGDVEVVILDRVARGLGIDVGNSLKLTVPPTTIVHSIARVVGTFVIRDPSDESWLGLSSSIFDPEQGATGGRPPIIALAHQESLARVARRGIADSGEIWALFYTDAATLDRINIDAALGAMTEFRKAVSRDLAGAIAFSGLQSAYLTLQRQLTFANTITIIAGSLFAAFALFNLGVHASVVSSRWSRDETLLQARGADRRQLVRAISTYALLLFVMPAALGPLIASAILPLLGTLTAFAELTNGETLPFRIGAEQFWWAGLASLATLVVFVSPLIKAHSGELVNRLTRIRVSGTPWFWRGNIDFGVMIAAAAVIVELNGRGTLFIVREDGSTGLSTLAASLPVVASVGAGLLSLRLLAAAGPIMDRVSRINLAPMAALGLRLLSRSTMQHAVLMLLASGVVIVGASALGLAGTLERSSKERVSFQTAFDLRIAGVDGAKAAQNTEVKTIVSKQWISDYAWGARTIASAGATETSRQFELLALQPEPFGANSWFRTDFSEQSLTLLMDSISVFNSPEKLMLPDATVGLSLDAVLERSGEGRMDLWARIVDGVGSTHTIRLAPDLEQNVGRWQNWTGTINDSIPRPMRLAAIQVYQPPTAPLGNVAELVLDSLSAVSAEGEFHTVSEFGDESVWHPMEASLPSNSELSPTASVAPDSRDGVALKVSMGKGTANGIRGIYYSSGAPTVVPILVSSGFRSATGLNVGDRFTGRAFGQLVPFVIKGDFGLFPTMSKADSSFAVANVDAMLAYMVPVSEPFLGNSAELFVNVHGETSPDQRIREIKAINPAFRVRDRSRLTGDSSAGFAATAGWRVVGVVISMTALAIASTAAVAFTLHRQEAFRIDHAVLESLGAGRLSIALESLLRTILSVTIGLGLGLISALLSLRFVAERMTRAETGESVLPPMQLAMDWTGIAVIVAAFTIAAVSPIVLLVWVRREAVAIRLRSAGTR